MREGPSERPFVRSPNSQRGAFCPGRATRSGGNPKRWNTLQRKINVNFPLPARRRLGHPAIVLQQLGNVQLNGDNLPPHPSPGQRLDFTAHCMNQTYIAASSSVQLQHVPIASGCAGFSWLGGSGIQGAQACVHTTSQVQGLVRNYIVYFSIPA